jgi:hypothetical protein
VVVDHDAALAFEPGGLGEHRRGADADRHDDDVRRNLAPVLEPTPATWPSFSMISCVSAPVRIVCPRRSSSVLSSQPAASSSCRSISVGIRWTTVTVMPWRLRPCAASSPSRPPPITTALPPSPAAASILSTSSRSRKVTTPAGRGRAPG